MNFGNNKLKLQVGVSVVVANLLLISANAGAAIILEHGFSASAGTAYHTNPQFLEQNKDSAYIYSLVPKYKLSALDGKNTWSGLAGIQLERSSNTQLRRNREDPFAEVGWTRDLFSGSVGLSGRYARQSSRNTQVADTGVVTSDGTSISRGFAADWTGALTERLNLTTRADYNKTDFEQAGNLSDFETRTLSAEVSYVFNETISPYMLVRATDYRSSNGITNDQARFQEYNGGVIVNLSSEFNFKAGAGVTHVTETGQNEWTGAAQLTYLGARNTLSVELSREFYGSASGLLERGDRFNTNYSYALSEKSNITTGLAFSRNESGNDSNQLTGSYVRQLTPIFDMDVYMAFVNLKRATGASIHDNVIGINFTYNSLNFNE